MYITFSLTAAAMLSRIKTVVDFIVASKAALGESDATTAIYNQQMKSLTEHLSATRVPLDEAAAIMKYLSTDADSPALTAFKDADRVRLVQSLTTSSDVAALSSPGKSLNQTHYYMHKYLTESDWKVLTSSTDTQQKIRCIVDRAIKIGLTHPSELSVVAMIAIITSSSRVPFGPSEVHNMVTEYKRMNKGLRGVVKQTSRTFPRSVEDFVASFPEAYGDEKPHQCPLTDDQIERERSTMAARKSHRTLSQQGGCMPAAGSNVSSMITSLASAIMGTMARRNEPNITLLQPPVRAPASVPPAQLLALPTPTAAVPLALLDASAADDSQTSHQSSPTPTPATRAAAAASSIDSVLGELGGVLGGDGPRKRPAAAQSMKRPAAALPDGAHVAAKRPSVTVVSTRNCVTARTGLPGPGQTKSVSIVDGDEETAKQKATDWLINACTENGIDIPDDW